VKLTHSLRSFNLLRSLWRYRGFIASAVAREFQARYQNSLLGALWMVLNPLAMILIYTLVFSRLMQARLPGVYSPFAYSIFLMAGLLPWGLFTEILTRNQNLFLENANLLKKASLPKICLPVIALCNSLVNFAIVFILFLLFLLWQGQLLTGPLLAFFPVLFLQIALAVGLGLILGILNVFFRDIGQFFTIFLQFWFWLTPILYNIDLLPEWVQRYLEFNPITPIVQAYHAIFVHAQMPIWQSLLYPLVCALVLNALAFRLYWRRSEEMVDEL
jgi:lipopolysaccharide transport system permease protein